MSSIDIKRVSFFIDKNEILKDINCLVPAGAFVALLGENGAGKTTLMDLLMGFKEPTHGQIEVAGEAPHLDNWQRRKKIAYLSEKVDIPGDWSVREFLDFNSFFYPNYSKSKEQELSAIFKLQPDLRIGNISAGEIRRVQIVGALAIEPEIIFIDEITAVLDIIGRRKLIEILAKLNQQNKCTILMSTNILEDLVHYVSHVLLIKKGHTRQIRTTAELLGGKSKEEFSNIIASELEAV